MKTETKGYTMDQVVEAIEMLSYSQGSYGRLLEEILYIKEHDRIKYEIMAAAFENQGFKDPLDVVLFFEQ